MDRVTCANGFPTVIRVRQEFKYKEPAANDPACKVRDEEGLVVVSSSR